MKRIPGMTILILFASLIEFVYSEPSTSDSQSPAVFSVLARTL